VATQTTPIFGQFTLDEEAPEVNELPLSVFKTLKRAGKKVPGNIEVIQDKSNGRQEANCAEDAKQRAT
jgi:hypothetical protein